MWGRGDCNTVWGRMPPSPFPPTNFLILGQKQYWGVKIMANCENCKKTQNSPENVPYIVHESSMARMERQIKRLWITVLVLIVMLVATNGAWILHESQMETIYQEVTQEADTGTNNFVGGDMIGETDYQNP